MHSCLPSVCRVHLRGGINLKPYLELNRYWPSLTLTSQHRQRPSHGPSGAPKVIKSWSKKARERLVSEREDLNTSIGIRCKADER